MADHGNDGDHLRPFGPDPNVAASYDNISQLLTALKLQFMEGMPPTAANINMAQQRAGTVAQDRGAIEVSPLDAILNEAVAPTPDVAASHAHPSSAQVPLPVPRPAQASPPTLGGAPPPSMSTDETFVPPESPGATDSSGLGLENLILPLAIRAGMGSAGESASRSAAPDVSNLRIGPPEGYEVTTDKIQMDKVALARARNASDGVITGPEQRLALPAPDGLSFEDFLAIMPLDSQGNPDVEFLTRLLGDENGARMLADPALFDNLTPEQKKAAMMLLQSGMVSESTTSGRPGNASGSGTTSRTGSGTSTDTSGKIVPRNPTASIDDNIRRAISAIVR